MSNIGYKNEREWEVMGSITDRDIPKSLKMVLAAPRLAIRLAG